MLDMLSQNFEYSERRYFACVILFTAEVQNIHLLLHNVASFIFLEKVYSQRHDILHGLPAVLKYIVCLNGLVK